MKVRREKDGRTERLKDGRTAGRTLTEDQGENRVLRWCPTGWGTKTWREYERVVYNFVSGKYRESTGNHTITQDVWVGETR